MIQVINPMAFGKPKQFPFQPKQSNPLQQAQNPLGTQYLMDKIAEDMA